MVNNLGNTDNKPLNRDVIKYIAMFTMLLNHIANIFMEQGAPATVALVGIGYFTAITMCYFLVEGYDYTRSKKKYGVRLLVVGIISELPFCLAFSGGNPKDLQFQGFDMIITLFICFIILVVNEKIKNAPGKVVLIVLLTLASTFCDWPLYAPLFTVLFIWSKHSRKRLALSYVIAALSFGGIYVIGGINSFNLYDNIICPLWYMTVILMSGMTIMFLYNGKRIEHGQKFSQWFFYLFYPVHLTVLWAINFLII